MRMISIKKLCCCLIGAILVTCCSWAANKSAKVPDKINVLLYNKTFAKRFGLDPKKAVKTDEGLYAVRYRFYKTDSKLSVYKCAIDFFVDSNLKINYPEGPDSVSGDFHAFMKQSGAAEMGLLKIPPQDSSKLEEIENAYTNAAELRFFITTNPMNHEEKLHQNYEPYTIDSYRINIFPGITLLSFKTSCRFIATMQRGSAIWLNKPNQPYTKKIDAKIIYNLEGYHIVEIPTSKIFSKYAKYGACVIDNISRNDMCSWSPKLCKHAEPIPDCTKFLPK